MKMTREQVIEELEALIEGFNEVYEAVPICLGEAVRLLKTEQRPHGEWVEKGHYTYCSECGKECATLYEFCPFCGADMREGDEE